MLIFKPTLIIKRRRKRKGRGGEAGVEGGGKRKGESETSRSRRKQRTFFLHGRCDEHMRKRLTSYPDLQNEILRHFKINI